MSTPDRLGEIIRSLGEGTRFETQFLLEALTPAEAAKLLEATPPKTRRVIWELLEDEQVTQVLQHLDETVRAEFLEAMDTEQLLAAADELDTDDFADILQQLPNTLTQQVLDAMSEANRERVESVLSYPEDSAGGLMNTDTIAVRPRHRIDLVMRYLRRQRELPEATDNLMVVNERDEFAGILPLTKILTADPSVIVREVMDAEVPTIPVDMSDAEVARIFAEYDLISAPVIDADGKLVGRITIDDVVDVIIEDANESLLAQAGLEDQETFAPIMRSARRRAIWLGINLITAFLAAAVINVFEETIAKVVALAVLMPIVASMGGIAGTQTLTLVVRGLALGQIARSNIGWFLNREIWVAVMNGLLWSTLVAIGAALAFRDPLLGLVIAVAMVINILVAAVSGSVLPSILTAIRVDPAIAGGVVLTTITDVAGFFTFLGLATLVYA